MEIHHAASTGIQDYLESAAANTTRVINKIASPAVHATHVPEASALNQSLALDASNRAAVIKV